MNSTSKIAWSLARSKSFNACPRQYYLNYILSRNGWKPTASEYSRTAYRCKSLTTLPAEMGTIVHRHIQKIILGFLKRVKPDVEQAMNKASEDLTAWVAESKTLPFHKLGAGKRKLILHELGEDIAEQELDAARNEIRAAIKTFLLLDITRDMRANPSRILPQCVDAQTFKAVVVDNILLLARTDLVLRSPFEIIDWKTGAFHQQHNQAAWVLDLYTRADLEVPNTEQSHVNMVYLGVGNVIDYYPTQEERCGIVDLAKQELSFMNQYEKRLQAGEDPATIFRAWARPYNCRSCPFQLVCPDAQTKNI